MPKKNLLIFMITTALLMSGWLWLKMVWMDQPQPKETAAAEKKETKDTAQAKKDTKDESPKKDADAGKVENKEPGKKDEPPAKAIVEEPVQYITLGDPKYPDYYISAKLTNRGGAVARLTLPKFQQADEDGNGVFLPDGTKAPLELIQDDPFAGSFRMFNYPLPDDTEKTGAVSTLGHRMWKVVRTSTTAELSEVVFSCDQIPDYPGLVIEKTYSLRPRQYHISLSIEISAGKSTGGKDQKPMPFRYQLAGSHGLPIEGEWYTSIYRTPMIGILDDRNYLWRNLDETQYRISHKEGGDRVPLDTLGTSRIQYAGVSTQYFSSLIVVDDKQAEGVKLGSLLAYCRPTLETQEMPGLFDHVDNTDPNRPKLLVKSKEPLAGLMAFLLTPRAKLQIEHRGLKKADHVFVNYYDLDDGTKDRVAVGVRIGNVPRPQLDDITVRVVSNILQMKPGDKVEHKFLLYHGPSKVRLLAQLRGDEAVSPELVDRYADTLHLRTLTDYRSAGPFGWFASQIRFTDVLILTTTLMHWLLYYLHLIVPNYGLSIIVLTLLVRGTMFPISRKSAMLSQKMQALAPEIKKVQEKYKDDPQAKTAAVMELYRKQGVNPFGSCLPMLLQLPFFLGLYYCLQESIFFRLAPFWPLWIDNLAAPDMLVRWGNGIPIISDPDNMFGSFFSFVYLGPYFNLLPVIAVALMLVQQKMMTPPPADEQQEMQQKMMKYMFVFIGIMFYKVAAGLCVYFIVSSLWGLTERKLLPKKQPATAPVAAPSSSNGSMNAGKPGRGKGKQEKKEKPPDGTVQKVKDWWADVLKQAQKK